MKDTKMQVRSMAKTYINFKTIAVILLLTLWIGASYFILNFQFHEQIMQSYNTKSRVNIPEHVTSISVLCVECNSLNLSIGDPNLTNNFSATLTTTIASGATLINNVILTSSQTNVTQHEILWLNLPVWIDINQENQKLSNSCNYKNCRMTVNRGNISSKSALIFSTQEELSEDPLELQKQRPKNQVWVFMRMEPPTIFNPSWYRDTKWRNTMNWSMGYRLDSDVFWPYAELPMLNNSSKVASDYHEIFQRKSKFAAWAVGNCETPGRREVFVDLLKAYGIPIDKFGKCSSQHKHEKVHDLWNIINKDYKFYLSFENSLCKDYVTEKFFRYYHLDTVLVVRGGVNYSEHFVNGTFIDTSNFASAKELATFLLMVNKTEEVYTEYLEKKDRLNFNPSGAYNITDTPFCLLCKKLNNVGISKTYDNIHSYIQNGTCSNPKDLS